VLIDVREADEAAEDGTIEGAVNIPLGQLIRKGRQGELDDLKGKTICTYCNGGYRGNIGADELQERVYGCDYRRRICSLERGGKEKCQMKQIGIGYLADLFYQHNNTFCAWIALWHLQSLFFQLFMRPSQK
jgi:rhodanese-related sulfurtransferase